MKKCIRIAVAVASTGAWEARGNQGSNATTLRTEALDMLYESGRVDGPVGLVWVEAEIDIPEDATTNGNVGEMTVP
jgi:hypothetical protein